MYIIGKTANVTQNNVSTSSPGLLTFSISYISPFDIYQEALGTRLNVE